MLWVIFAGLAGVAVFSILWPLAHAPRNTAPLEHDVGFYRAQLEEIARDEARAVISAEDAEVAKTEAGRRLIAASEQRGETPALGSRFSLRLTALGALVFVPLVALGLYSRVGHPDWPDQPLLARLTASPERMDIAAAIAKIEAHLKLHPDDGRGYEVLVPAYIRSGRFEEAVSAAKTAVDRLGETPQRLATYGEKLVFANNGGVSDEAVQVFEKAAARDPAQPAALYYLGLAAGQRGDVAKAKEIWENLVARAPANAPWRRDVAARLEALAKAETAQNAQNVEQGKVPDGGEAIAALPPGEREQAIRGMVARLAVRLSENGQDLDGWLRLMRAYKVLNDADRAREALVNARKNFASDPAGRARIDALARELGLET